jgi:REP element-mobilizing transposase RayT
VPALLDDIDHLIGSGRRSHGRNLDLDPRMHSARLHHPGGLYYISLHGSAGQRIVIDEEDRNELERLVALCVERDRVRVHAFCWLAREIHLAMQISEVPLGRIIQSFASPHAQRIQRKRAQRGHLFAGAYRALLADAAEYLPSLVRHIHRAPIRAGVVKVAEQYPWSSHRAYLGRTIVPWLTVDTTLNHFARGQKVRAREAYRQFVDADVAATEIEHFEMSRPHRQIVGSQAFIESVLGRRPQARPFESLDHVIDSVVRTLRVAREDVLSMSRERKLSLARAVIAWQATRAGVATLTEVARYLNRDPSTLSVAIRRYRALRPALFTLPSSARLER